MKPNARWFLVASVLSMSAVHAQAPESSWGWAHGTPQGMTGPDLGAVIATGTLGGTDHGWSEGYAVIGPTTIMLPPQSVGWDHLRRYKGQRVELVVRPVERRQLEQVKR